jgi:hypothetical protein
VIKPIPFAGAVYRLARRRDDVAPGAWRRFTSIISRVEEAQAGRPGLDPDCRDPVCPPLRRRVLALATGTYVLTRDARWAMTVLPVACPCAGRLRHPTAISAAIGNGARHGALIKSGTHPQGTGQVTAVVPARPAPSTSTARWLPESSRSTRTTPPPGVLTRSVVDAADGWVPVECDVEWWWL